MYGLPWAFQVVEPEPSEPQGTVVAVAARNDRWG
jgi:hypothetical protein